jgi:hypothetical protein
MNRDVFRAPDWVTTEPICFRHVMQWHSPTLTGSPRASIRTATQQHDPVLIGHFSLWEIVGTAQGR